MASKSSRPVFRRLLKMACNGWSTSRVTSWADCFGRFSEASKRHKLWDLAKHAADQQGFRGQGMTIAMVDTGYLLHPFFAVLQKKRSSASLKGWMARSAKIKLVSAAGAMWVTP
jgi:hypothetical protein